MPKWINQVILILIVLSFLPLSLIYVTRAQRNDDTRHSIIPDMDDQQRYDAQELNTMFADQRAMRPQVEGTIAVGQLEDDPHFYTGIVDGRPVQIFPETIPGPGGDVPLVIDEDFMARGQERFNIYCTMCHGHGGFGNGLVAQRLDEMLTDPDAANYENTWVPPANLHDKVVRERPVGHIFNTITNGTRNMPPYGPQIEPLDRWAIVAYVRALQRSQAWPYAELPESLKRHVDLKTPPGLLEPIEQQAGDTEEVTGEATEETGRTEGPSDAATQEAGAE